MWQPDLQASPTVRSRRCKISKWKSGCGCFRVAWADGFNTASEFELAPIVVTIVVSIESILPVWETWRTRALHPVSWRELEWTRRTLMVLYSTTGRWSMNVLRKDLMVRLHKLIRLTDYISAVILNWDCMVGVLQSAEYLSTIAKCGADFQTAISPFPGKVEACGWVDWLIDWLINPSSDAQTMITCMTIPVQQACGHQLANVNCGAIKAGMNQIWPGWCDFACWATRNWE